MAPRRRSLTALGQERGWLNARNATLTLIAITLVLRLVGAWAIGLGTGEAYYVATARHLALSYYDQPPLSLWTIWATLQIAPTEHPLFLRLPFIVMFAITTWLVFRLGERLHSALAGFFAALIVNGSVLFSLSIGSWMQPDAPMMLFWVATVLVLVDIFLGTAARRPYRAWLLAGLLLGLTLLSKYHGIFIAAGTGLFMLVNRDARRWFAHPAPYLAALLALALFSPVIIWNAQNGWASFGFQGGRALAQAGLRWDRLLRMIWGQLLYMTPWLALPALYVGVRAVLAGPTGRFPPLTLPGAATLFAAIGWPPILVFTAVALWSDTQFHFHWQAPGYLMLFVLMGAWAAEALLVHTRAVRLWLYGGTALTLVLLTLVVTHAATGWGRTLVPGNWADPTAVQLPWTPVGAALEARDAFAQDNTFVAGTTWIDCGYVDAQVRGRAPLLCLGAEPRNLGYGIDPARFAGWDAYVVAHAGDPQAVIARIGDSFASVEPVETVSVERGGRTEIGDIRIFHATGFTGAP